ncbi:mannose-P-dolichol utilization defect 1 protein homolog [Dendroctonus ponderosae]|uniref:Mannose-P-dolichol utilization defect 1 protein homolog n=1 Tax=Dendroctonus ponderosae TaxID=77166 RepID=J3JUY7_DENPD
MSALELLRQVSQLVFTPKCFDNYFIDFNLADVECFKSTLSKGLGLGLILGSILVKLPQILKIVKNKSGQGISLIGVSLELVAIMIYMSYNYVNSFPFNSWGDTFFVGVQTLIIAALVLSYSGKVVEGLVYVIVVLSGCYVLMSGITPMNLLRTLTSVNISLVVGSKLTQAYTNYMNGHTGQLSAVTLILLLAGSVARVFTSIQETGDNIAIATYVASSTVNALLVGQLIYYWNAVQPANKSKSE